MSIYTRHFVIYDRERNTVKALLVEGVSHAEFDYECRGGTKNGKIEIAYEWSQRYFIEIGDWVEFWYNPYMRVYTGRVVKKTATPEGGLSLELQGPLDLLADIKVGSRTQKLYYGDNIPKNARKDRNAIIVRKKNISEIVYDLLLRYLNKPPQDMIYVSSAYIHPTSMEVGLLRFDGNTDLVGALNDLALRAGAYTWGIDEAGIFYFHPVTDYALLTFRVGVNAKDVVEDTSLDETYTMVTIRGGWVYGRTPKPKQYVREFVNSTSQAIYGPRKLEFFSPLIVEDSDAEQLANAILYYYSAPTTKISFTVPHADLAAFDTTGIRLFDVDGSLLVFGDPFRLHVNFDEGFEVSYVFDRLTLKRPVEKWDDKHIPSTSIDDAIALVLGTKDLKSVSIVLSGVSIGSWLAGKPTIGFCHTRSDALSKISIGSEFQIVPEFELPLSTGQYAGRGHMGPADPDIPDFGYAPGGINTPVALPTLAAVTFDLLHIEFDENSGGWEEVEGDYSVFQIVDIKIPAGATWSDFVPGGVATEYRIEMGTPLTPREKPRWVKIVNLKES